MTPPLDKARGLMALSEKATPGTWFHCQPFQRVEKNRTVHGSVAGQWVDFISTEPAPVHRRIVVPMHDAESNNRVTSEDMAFIAAACNFARTDLHALVAEVERLRSLLGEASEYLHDVPKESADGDSCASLARRIRAELSTAPATEPQS